jgi:hypothetical protein
MKVVQAMAAVALCAVSSTSLACTLPPLVAIPAKDKVGDQAPAIREATNAYFEAMKSYTGCVQAALTEAGGDAAPTLMKTILIGRNNAAVAEAEAVKKLFEANVGFNVVPAATFNQDASKKDQKSK